MSKYIVTVFDSKQAAYEGVRALIRLDDECSIDIYEGAVLTKNDSGEVRILYALEEGPFGMLGGIMLGNLIGITGGLFGAMAVAAGGSLGGMLVDLGTAGVNDEFLDNIARKLSPGKYAVLAEVEGGCTLLVDTKMQALGGVVYRST